MLGDTQMGMREIVREILEGGDLLPQLLASGPEQAFEAYSLWMTSGQRMADTP